MCIAFFFSLLNPSIHFVYTYICDMHAFLNKHSSTNRIYFIYKMGLVTSLWCSSSCRSNNNNNNPIYYASSHCRFRKYTTRTTIQWQKGILHRCSYGKFNTQDNMFSHTQITRTTTHNIYSIKKTVDIKPHQTTNIYFHY